MQPSAPGKVTLVGAGPGAADLLTLRALRAIQAADVVLHDALVGDDVIALIPPRAKRIAVGKRAHRPSTPQDFINRLMARLARGGAQIVRLKGGDPNMFGRAGEERAFLEACGVVVETVPGITTASAAAAQFGFSLTERAVARRVLFATGRTLAHVNTDWRAAADPETTLCLYMGCAAIAEICARLIEAGRSPRTPALAAVGVERPGARLIKSALGELALDVTNIGDAPVFIAIGEVCERATASDASSWAQSMRDEARCTGRSTALLNALLG